MTNAAENKKYALYARKSSESDERQIQSIDDQLERMRKVASDNSLTVVSEITEAKSAKAPDTREGFKKLVHLIDTGKANAILVWKWDRLSRNPIDSGRLEWMLQNEQIQEIRTPDRVFQPEDNAIITSVEASMANQYIRDLSTNVKRGLRAKIEKGWMPCRAPQGYLNSKRAERGTNIILIDPDRFSLVKRAWKLMLTGAYTPAEILKKLNDEWGYRTPKGPKSGNKPMALATIYRIFNNPFYAGLVEYSGTITAGKHQPMITVDEFDRVQEMIGSNRRLQTKRHQYLYTGLFKCAECGGQVSGTVIKKKLKSTDKEKFYTLYYCIRGRRAEGCSKRTYTNVSIIDKQVAQVLASLKLRPAISRWALKYLDDKRRSFIVEKDTDKERREEAQKSLERQLKTLTNLRVRGLIADAEFISERERIDTELARVAIQANETRGQEAERAQAIKLCDRAFDTFRTGTFEQRREIVHKICSNWHLDGKQTSYTLVEWAMDVQALNSCDISELELFEPASDGSTKGLNKRARTQYSTLCALVDRVRTELPDRPKTIVNSGERHTLNTRRKSWMSRDDISEHQGRNTKWDS